MSNGMAKEKIGFSHDGIGRVLKQNKLGVPLNQREYSWEIEHVQALLEDFNGAMEGAEQTYFLGTLVLTTGKERPEVADGQQRLATVSLFLATIYDFFTILGNKARADNIREYLKTSDLETEQTVPRLRLNVEDNEFFLNYVLSEPDSAERLTAVPTKPSHKLIKAAADFCREFLGRILSTHKDAARQQAVINWVKFIENDAQVIVLTVPDHLDAFEMFETLNDRGLKASQADLIKNFVFGRSGDRIGESQHRWMVMSGTLDSIGGKDDLTVTFLRHLVICQQGPTKERELFRRVKLKIVSPQTAVAFMDEAAEGAAQYAALFNPDHVVWNEYGNSGRNFIRTLSELRVIQIRPLMFAVLREFPAAQAKLAFKLLVSWSVRFLIVGGRGGLLDRNYALRAHEVTTGAIKTAKDLVKAMADVVPADATFEVSFSEARVSQAFLSKYYLRALERHVKSDPEPEFIPSEEESINVEHILPMTPGVGWEHVSEETADAFSRRLGNQVLLKAKKNVEIGNKPFSIKKPTLEQSAYILTAQAGNKAAWGPAEITSRQKQLAALAVKTWPITI